MHKDIKKIIEDIQNESKNAKVDKIYLNEINTLPGFTEISMYPKLMINEKISYKNLITYLLQE